MTCMKHVSFPGHGTMTPHNRMAAHCFKHALASLTVKLNFKIAASRSATAEAESYFAMFSPVHGYVHVSLYASPQADLSADSLGS